MVAATYWSRLFLPQSKTRILMEVEITIGVTEQTMQVNEAMKTARKKYVKKYDVNLNRGWIESIYNWPCEC